VIFGTTSGGPSFRSLTAKGRVAFQLCLLASALLRANAQSAPQPGPPTPSPGSTVIFSRDETTAPDASPQSAQPSPVFTTPSQFALPAPASISLGPGDPDPLNITYAERTSLFFTAYDLDLHLAPARAGISARAAVTVRNDGTAPLTRIVLQISSTLHWEAISLSAGTSATPVRMHYISRLVDTDADHTGSMSEAVVDLPAPLAPGASLSMITLYSGAVPQSANRLTRIGAPALRAAAQDWDAIAPTDPTADIQTGTALRGFGNVLWYPVSAPPVFLGDAAKLFDLVGRTKLHESAATLRARLAIEYNGEPPDAAYLCGRRTQLTAHSDDPDVPVADAPGIATAIFDAQPLGFRTPSLFITAAAPHLVDDSHLAIITGRESAIAPLASAAAQVEPLLASWLGPEPEQPLTLLDHAGDPFSDDALLVYSLSGSNDPTATAGLKDPLTLVPLMAPAWIHSAHPWIDQGLPEFMSLLWTEHIRGRPAALAALQESDRALALVEPDFSDPNHAPSPAGASLANASGDVFYRNKAAAVWWMLRAIAGDDMLKQAIQTYRKDPRLDADPQGFEHVLETASHMDLAWFFRDWVYNDRGLPDLRIANVTPSQLQRNGSAAGWLVAVEVHNDGGAEAQVPITVRSADATETHQLRVPAHASASVRVPFAGRPDQVQVNDGTVPETQTTVHTRELVMPAK